MKKTFTGWLYRDDIRFFGSKDVNSAKIYFPPIYHEEMERCMNMKNYEKVKVTVETVEE